MSKRLFFFIALSTLLIAFSGYGQPVPSATQTGQGKIVPEMSGQSVAPEIEQAQPKAELVTPGGPKLVVEKFVISGNSKISSGVLEGLVEPYAGKETDLAGLKRIADVITDYYHKKGYFLARAYVPAQKIKDGTVEIEVLEGKLGKVTVSGNQYYTTKFLKSRFAPVREAGVISRENLEKPLLQLNEEPKLKASVLLTPGEEFGTSDVHLNVKDSFPYDFSLFYNNFGNKYTQYGRLGATLDLGNLAQYGDVLHLGFVTPLPDTKYSFFNQLGYTLPLGTTGLKLGLQYVQSEYDVGSSLAALDIVGKSQTYGFTVSYPLLKMTDREIGVFGGINYYKYRNFILGYQSSEDKMSILNVGINGQVTQNGWLNLPMHTWYQLNLSEGLGSAFGGDNDPSMPSKPGAKAEFTKANLDVSNTTKLGKCSLILRGSGQLASRTLAVGQDFSIGGDETVRGYSEGEYVGDEGYVLSAELRTPFWPGGYEINKYAQWAFFIDTGKVHLLSPLPGEPTNKAISGYGFGIRAAPTDYFSFRADVGFPLKGPDPSNGNSAQVYVEAVLHF